MQAFGKRPTCIRIVVLHILKTCGIVDDEDIVLSHSDKSLEEVTPPHSARASRVPRPRAGPKFQQSRPRAGPGFDVSGPKTNTVFEQSGPQKAGFTDQVGPPSYNDHSPESSSGQGSTLSDHATHSGSDTSPDRERIGPSTADEINEAPSDNDPLVGFGSPLVSYGPDEEDEEVVIVGLLSLGAKDRATAKGKRPVDHRSSSESEEIRNAKLDRVKRRVVDPIDEAIGPSSQQVEVDRLTTIVNN
ncbi:hypothetical protein R1sor_011166 [Riccia sorocarpa]|uniref:Uncharacterized protein n=1 Tax=Riccia sorocarpa TaxID=122646 RepID=A0ABD3I3R5_9MARC